MTVDLDALEALARAATHDGAVVVMAIDPRDVLALIARVRQLEQSNATKATRIAELLAAINTPRTDDFVESVRNEAAHQIERWGVEHDAGKRAEDWISLFVYLLGKATKAHYDNDQEKLLHHVVTVAAVAMNWHRNLTGENTLMRPGVAPEHWTEQRAALVEEVGTLKARVAELERGA